jgi:hypothetical protein
MSLQYFEEPFCRRVSLRGGFLIPRAPAEDKRQQIPDGAKPPKKVIAKGFNLPMNAHRAIEMMIDQKRLPRVPEGAKFIPIKIFSSFRRGFGNRLDLNAIVWIDEH